MVFLVQAVGYGSSSRFVDDSHDIQACNGACVLGGLSLGVIKIGRDSDNRILDFLADVGFSNLFHLCQDHRRNLLWMEFFHLAFVLYYYRGLSLLSCFNFERPVFQIRLDYRVVEFTPNQSLRIENGVVGILRCLIIR